MRDRPPEPNRNDVTACEWGMFGNHDAWNTEHHARPKGKRNVVARLGGAAQREPQARLQLERVVDRDHLVFSITPRPVQ